MNKELRLLEILKKSSPQLNLESTMPPEQSVPPTSDPLDPTDDSDYSYDPDADVPVDAVVFGNFC